MRRSRKGLFIAIEGIDQSGKKTQAQLLSQVLTSAGYCVASLSFPDYSTPIGKEILSFLANRRNYDLHVRYLLYAANQWEHVDRITEALDSRSIVIANRYYSSNIAYGLAQHLDIHWMSKIAEGLPRPDLTILIDIQPCISSRRKRKGRDIYEANLKLLTSVRKAYLAMAKQDNWEVVNGNSPAPIVADHIREVMNGFLRRKKMAKHRLNNL